MRFQLPILISKYKNLSVQ